MTERSRCITFNKGAQRYVFTFAAGRETDLLAVLLQMAEDRRYDFDWFDAAVISFEMGRRTGRPANSMMALGG